MVPAVLALLAEKGLSLISKAVIAKGTSAIEEKLGIKLPTTEAELTPELELKLLELQNANQQILITAAVEAQKNSLAAETAAAGEVTGRWTADVASDSKLAKNVRPAALVYLLFVFTLFAVVGAFGVTIPESYTSLLGDLLQMVFAAYFVGRTVEKGIDKTLAIITAVKGGKQK